jgi:hypothetical protein
MNLHPISVQWTVISSVFLLQIVNKQKREEIHNRFWRKNMMEGGHLEYLGLKANYTKMDLQGIGGKVLIGFR